jgi:hypothetical protein
MAFRCGSNACTRPDGGLCRSRPAAGVATGYKAAVGESSAVQDVYWGRRRHRHFYGYYGSPYPYWRYYSGLRYNYYGYAPGLRFYYGAPRHRHWRRWY